MVTVRIWPAVNGKSMGSEQTMAPLGTRKEAEPRELLKGAGEGPMVMEVMGRSETSKALEHWSRILEGFWVEQAVWQRVAASKTTLLPF
jgi:hypothetical protein